MTREEAIKYLKEMKDECNDTIHKVRYVTKEDALDMAIKALEQEPCDDAISRQAVIDAIMANNIRENEYNLTSSRIKKAVENLPSVKQEAKYCDRNICIKNEYNGIGCDECEVTKSQEPKTGHWDRRTCKCSECGYQITFSEYTEHKYKYCPNCGARMVKPQESEDKE